MVLLFPLSIGPYGMVLFVTKKLGVLLEYLRSFSSMVNGRICVTPLEEITKLGLDKWKHCAIRFFLGKRPFFMLVKKHLEKMWVNFGLCNITS